MKKRMLALIGLMVIVTGGAIAVPYYRFYCRYDYKIVVDFSIPSCKDRFFVYDRQDNLIFKCRCAHGSGKGSTKEKPVFSNRPGSNCSSLGNYLVCNKRTYSRKALGLIGLSKSNYNAPARGILIHGGLRNYPSYIPMNPKISQGCFTIPTPYLNKLVKLSKNSTVRLQAVCRRGT